MSSQCSGKLSGALTRVTVGGSVDRLASSGGRSEPSDLKDPADSSLFDRFGHRILC